MMHADYAVIVTKNILKALREEGFSKKGRILIREQGDLVAILQPQKSLKSTKNHTILTVNVGIYWPELQKIKSEEVKNPSIPSCQWRTRIGHLMPENDDYWWEIRDENGANLVSDSIINKIKKYVLPKLDRINSSEKLVAEWRKGVSPGLTSGQCSKCLELVNKAQNY